jgi:hypothetical protein
MAEATRSYEQERIAGTVSLNLPDLESLFLNFCLFYISASYDGVKGCNVWDPTAHKIVINKDIVCMEQPEGLVQDHNEDLFAC